MRIHVNDRGVLDGSAFGIRDVARQRATFVPSGAGRLRLNLSGDPVEPDPPVDPPEDPTEDPDDPDEESGSGCSLGATLLMWAPVLGFGVRRFRT